MILKYTVLILVLIKITLSYKQYKYHELCPGNKFKAIFDTITNNKPEVRLGKSNYESAALVHSHSTSSTNRKMGSCEFTVKLDNPDDSNGIFVNIKKLKLREYSYGYDHTCRDYLRFTYKNGTQTREICGNIETTAHNNLIRNFFDVSSGEFKVEISIGSDYSSDPSDAVEVDLVFTAYTNCYGDSMLRCSPEKCISDVFRDDKIINCPPPDCLDESNCVNHEKPVVVSIGESAEESAGSAHIIVPIVIVVIAALAGILCFCKKKKTTANSQRPNDGDHVEELRPTTRSDLDSYLEFQDVRPMPAVPQQRPYPTMPLVPEEGYRPMPLVPPDQRYDIPAPSAPPNGFKDDPPPYDELFRTNQTTRGNV